MKIAFILLIAITAVFAAPVEDSASVKAKRGLALGLGYHAPLVTSSYVAPTIVHHEPIISHAPLIAHAPVLHSTYSYHLPTLHTLHHF